MTNLFAGIQISKNRLDFCIADSAHQIKGSHKIRMSSPVSHSGFIKELESGFRALIEMSSIHIDRVAAVGISMPASLDHRSGSVVCSTSMPWLKGLNVKEELASRLRKFIVLDTEANVRAFIEHKLGCAGRCSNFILVLLDPGVSAGIYINGMLLRSRRGTTPELGHIVIEPYGRKCTCGERGCLESYASPDAIIRYYLKHRKHTQSNGVSINDLFRLARMSDTAALNAFYKMGNYLGVALINTINIIKPEAVIFAGEFSKGLNFFLPAVKSTLDTRAYSGLSNGIMYKKSAIASGAVQLGLLHLAKDSYTKAYNLKICDDIFII